LLLHHRWLHDWLLVGIDRCHLRLHHLLLWIVRRSHCIIRLHHHLSQLHLLEALTLHCTIILLALSREALQSSWSFSVNPGLDALSELNFVEGDRGTVHCKVCQNIAELWDLCHDSAITESTVKLVAIDIFYTFEERVKRDLGIILDFPILWELCERLLAGLTHVCCQISWLLR
jgi:hypothetical protein